MLTLPLIIAAISAGLIGGFHCVGMCGGIASLLSRLPSIKESLSFSSNMNEDLMPTLAGQTKQRVIAIHPVQESALGGDSVRQFDQIAYQCKLHGHVALNHAIFQIEQCFYQTGVCEQGDKLTIDQSYCKVSLLKHGSSDFSFSGKAIQHRSAPDNYKFQRVSHTVQVSCGGHSAQDKQKRYFLR